MCVEMENVPPFIAVYLMFILEEEGGRAEQREEKKRESREAENIKLAAQTSFSNNDIKVIFQQIFVYSFQRLGWFQRILMRQYLYG